MLCFAVPFRFPPVPAVESVFAGTASRVYRIPSGVVGTAVADTKSTEGGDDGGGGGAAAGSAPDPP